MPQSVKEIVLEVERLSAFALSAKARDELSVLAEECLNVEFLEDSGINTLDGVLEDLEERCEIWIKSSNDNLKDATSAWCSTPEGYKSNLKEARASLKAFKDCLKAVEQARASL